MQHYETERSESAPATCLCEAATKYFKDLRIRADFSDGDPGFEESFYVLLTQTLCAACLTENGYMDSRESLAYITSSVGKDAIPQKSKG